MIWDASYSYEKDVKQSDHFLLNRWRREGEELSSLSRERRIDIKQHLLDSILTSYYVSVSVSKVESCNYSSIRRAGLCCARMMHYYTHDITSTFITP